MSNSSFSYTFKCQKDSGNSGVMDLGDMLSMPSYQRLSGGDRYAKPWRVVRYYLELKHGLHQMDRHRNTTVIEYFTASKRKDCCPIMDDEFIYPGEMLILQRHPAPQAYSSCKYCEPHQPYDFYDPEVFYGSEELAMLAALNLAPESEAAAAANSAWRTKSITAKVHPSSYGSIRLHPYTDSVPPPRLPGVPKSNYVVPSIMTTILLEPKKPAYLAPVPTKPAIAIRASVHSKCVSVAEYFKELAAAASSADATAVCLYYPGPPRPHMVAEHRTAVDVSAMITTDKAEAEIPLSRWLFQEVLDDAAAATTMLCSPGALSWTREAISVAKATRAATDKSSCETLREWVMRFCLVAAEAGSTLGVTFVCAKKKAS